MEEGDQDGDRRLSCAFSPWALRPRTFMPSKGLARTSVAADWMCLRRCTPGVADADADKRPNRPSWTS